MCARALLLPLVLGAALAAAPAPGSAQGPALVVDGLEQREDGVYLHAFGVAAQEQELEATFRLRNGGDAPLAGLRAIGDCGCYGVTLSATSLAPGATADVGVKFRTLMMSGVVTKRLRLAHDADGGRPVTIRLRVDIVAGVVIEPHRFFFENVLVGSRPQATVVAKWRQDVGRPFRVTGVEVPELDVEVEQEPYADGSWKGTSITLRFATPPPMGILSGTALLSTDHPDYPRIPLALTANVTGRVWVQSRVVYLGWVPEGQGRVATLLVRPYDDSVDLGEVAVSSRSGKVEVEVAPAPPGPDPGWQVRITVPEDAARGRLDDTIEIRTAVPGEEITEIEVRGEVIPRGR